MAVSDHKARWSDGLSKLLDGYWSLDPHVEASCSANHVTWQEQSNQKSQRSPIIAPSSSSSSEGYRTRRNVRYRQGTCGLDCYANCNA